LCGNSNTETLCRLTCIDDICVRQDNSELFTPIATDKIFQTQDSTQAARDFMEDHVTRLVPPGIVDPFDTKLQSK
jgi:hypothetical protein